MSHRRAITAAALLVATTALVGCQSTAGVSPVARDRLSAAGFEARLTQHDTVGFSCSRERCGEVAVLAKTVETANTRVYGGFTVEAMIRSGAATDADLLATIGPNLKSEARQQGWDVTLTRLAQFTNARNAGVDVDFVGRTRNGIAIHGAAQIVVRGNEMTLAVSAAQTRATALRNLKLLNEGTTP